MQLDDERENMDWMDGSWIGSDLLRSAVSGMGPSLALWR
jgi:hypothetical protein